MQPVREICERLKQLNIREKRGQHYRIFLHTDAAQTVGKIRVDVSDLGVDYLTIVGHKVRLVCLHYPPPTRRSSVSGRDDVTIRTHNVFCGTPGVVVEHKR